MWHVLCPCPLRGKHEFQAGRWRETRRWLSLDLHLGKAMNEFLLGPGPQISGKRGFITVWVYELWGCMTFTKSKWSIGSCLRHCVCLKFINRIVNLPRPLWLRKLCNKVLLGYRLSNWASTRKQETRGPHIIAVPCCSTCSYGIGGTYRGQSLDDNHGEATRCRLEM